MCFLFSVDARSLQLNVLSSPTGDPGKIRTAFMSGPFRSKQAAKEGLQEIGSIIDLCRQMGMSNIKVAPLLATNYDLHRNGTIFESHIVRGKSRDIIAAGGRYVRIWMKRRDCGHILMLPALQVRRSGHPPCRPGSPHVWPMPARRRVLLGHLETFVGSCRSELDHRKAGDDAERRAPALLRLLGYPTVRRLCRQLFARLDRSSTRDCQGLVARWHQS